MFAPIWLPNNLASTMEFEIARVDYVSPETSGRLTGVQAGFPKWLATWNIGTISARTSDEMSAFLDRLRGSQRHLIGYEPGREVPRFHRDGTPFSHSAASWSQTIAADGTALLTLNGLLPGMVLSHRDYVGFLWDDWKRALVRCVEQRTAAGNGSMTIAVEPAIPNLVPGSAVAVLNRPGCLMKLTSETLRGTMGRRLALGGGKIVAAQDLVP